MPSNFEAWTLSELNDCYERLGAAAVECRALNEYPLAARLRALQAMVNQATLAKEARLRQGPSSTQLSLVPPGAYDGPF